MRKRTKTHQRPFLSHPGALKLDRDLSKANEQRVSGSPPAADFHSESPANLLMYMGRETRTLFRMRFEIIDEVAGF
jgi:hypothetical protein